MMNCQDVPLAPVARVHHNTVTTIQIAVHHQPSSDTSRSSSWEAGEVLCQCQIAEGTPEDIHEETPQAIRQSS